jgi:hypothetical protein
MSNHYGFFTSFGNDPMHNQFVRLSSSTSYGGDSHHLMGRGAYIHSSNIRHCFTLFSVRYMVKSNWQNSNDLYIGKPKR